MHRIANPREFPIRRFDSYRRLQIYSCMQIGQSALTFNQVCAGSNPVGNANKCSVRLMVRSPPFQGENRGSNPLQSANEAPFVYWLGYLILNQMKRGQNPHGVPIVK